MKNISCQYFLNPFFLLSLALLLLNDFFLKAYFHNWITGKLSDVTGLFVFSQFFIGLFPHLRKEIIISTAFFFRFLEKSCIERAY